MSNQALVRDVPKRLALANRGNLRQKVRLAETPHDFRDSFRSGAGYRRQFG